VADLFDGNADRFDLHLVELLQYRAPEVVCEALGRHVESGARLDFLDAGCGTGLGGLLLMGWARTLVGVDLSPKMVAQAERRGVYTRVEVGELVAFLRGHGGAFDVVAAVDVLVYLGDLRPVFGAAAEALRAGGLFAFSVEAREVETYALLASHRYAHGSGYVRKLAEEAGFSVMEAGMAPLRAEGGVPVMGEVWVVRR
jgi:predicted TPR repeat methyltransferase